MSDFNAKNVPNLISAKARPQTPLGELTALPRPHSCIQGAVLLRGKKGMGREGKIRKRRREKEGRGKEGT